MLSIQKASPVCFSQLSQLFSSEGGSTTGKLTAIVGSRDGLRLTASSINGVKNYGNDSTKFISGAISALIKQTTGLSDIFQNRFISKVGTKNPTTLLNDLSFAQQYEATVDPAGTSA